MSTMALQLPSSFVDVERDEMEYIDGGGGVIETSILSLGALAMTLGAFMWNVGKEYRIGSVQSRAILSVIIGASAIGSIYITKLERAAWNKIKIFWNWIF